MIESEEKKTLKSWSVPSLHAVNATNPVEKSEPGYVNTYKHGFEARVLGSKYQAGLHVAETITDENTSGTETSGSDVSGKSPSFIEGRKRKQFYDQNYWINAENSKSMYDEDRKPLSECDSSCKSSTYIGSEGFCAPDWSAAGEEYIEDLETSSDLKDEAEFSQVDEPNEKNNDSYRFDSFMTFYKNNILNYSELSRSVRSENKEIKSEVDNVHKEDQSNITSQENNGSSLFLDYSKGIFSKVDLLENESAPQFYNSEASSSDITDAECLYGSFDNLDASNVSEVTRDSLSDEEIENRLSNAANIVVQSIIQEEMATTNVTGSKKIQRKTSEINLVSNASDPFHLHIKDSNSITDNTSSEKSQSKHSLVLLSPQVVSSTSNTGMKEAVPISMSDKNIPIASGVKYGSHNKSSELMIEKPAEYLKQKSTSRLTSGKAANLMNFNSNKNEAEKKQTGEIFGKISSEESVNSTKHMNPETNNEKSSQKTAFKSRDMTNQAKSIQDLSTIDKRGFDTAVSSVSDHNVEKQNPLTLEEADSNIFPLRIQSEGHVNELLINQNRKAIVNLEKLELQRKLSGNTVSVQETSSSQNGINLKDSNEDGINKQNDNLEFNTETKFSSSKSNENTYKDDIPSDINVTLENSNTSKDRNGDVIIKTESKCTLPSSDDSFIGGQSDADETATLNYNSNMSINASSSKVKNFVTEVEFPADGENVNKPPTCDEHAVQETVQELDTDSQLPVKKPVFRPHSASTNAELQSSNANKDLNYKSVGGKRRGRPHSASVSHEVIQSGSTRAPPSLSNNDCSKQRSRSTHKSSRSFITDKVCSDIKSDDYISSTSVATPSAASENVDMESMSWSNESVNKYREFAKMRKRELLARFVAERKHKEELDQLLVQLHDSYDKLLAKHAEAENTIDQLRLGKPIKLDSTRVSPQINYIHCSPVVSHVSQDSHKNSPVHSENQSVFQRRNVAKEQHYPSRRSIGIEANLVSNEGIAINKAQLKDASCQTEICGGYFHEPFRSSVASLLLRANCLLEQVNSLQECAIEGIKIDSNVGQQMCNYLWESLLALQRDLNAHSGHIATLEYFALEDAKCLLAKIQTRLLTFQAKEKDSDILKESEQTKEDSKNENSFIQLSNELEELLDSSKKVLSKTSSYGSLPPSPISNVSKVSDAHDSVSLVDADSGCHSSDKNTQHSANEATYDMESMPFEAVQRSSSSCISRDIDKVESKSSNESECLNVVKTLLKAMHSASSDVQNNVRNQILQHMLTIQPDITKTNDNVEVANRTSPSHIDKENVTIKPRSEINIRSKSEEALVNPVKTSFSVEGDLTWDNAFINAVDSDVNLNDKDNEFDDLGGMKTFSKLLESLNNEDYNGMSTNRDSILPSISDRDPITPLSGKSTVCIPKVDSQRSVLSETETIVNGIHSSNDWNSLMNQLKNSVTTELTDNKLQIDNGHVCHSIQDSSVSSLSIESPHSVNAEEEHRKTKSQITPKSPMRAEISEKSKSLSQTEEKLVDEYAQMNGPVWGEGQQVDKTLPNGNVQRSITSTPNVCTQCHNRYICDCSGDTQYGNRLSMICELLQEQLQSLNSSSEASEKQQNKITPEEILVKLLDEIRCRLLSSLDNKGNNTHVSGDTVVSSDEKCVVEDDSVNSINTQDSMNKVDSFEKLNHEFNVQREYYSNAASEIMKHLTNSDISSIFPVNEWEKLSAQISLPLEKERDHIQESVTQSDGKFSTRHITETDISESSAESISESETDPLCFPSTVESLILQAGQSQSGLGSQSVSTTYVYLSGDREVKSDRSMLQKLNEEIQLLRHELLEKNLHADNASKMCSQSCQTEVPKVSSCGIETEELRPGPFLNPPASYQTQSVTIPETMFAPHFCNLCGASVFGSGRYISEPNMNHLEQHKDFDKYTKSIESDSDTVLHCCGMHHIVKKKNADGRGVSADSSKHNEKEDLQPSPLLCCPFCLQQIKNSKMHYNEIQPAEARVSYLNDSNMVEMKFAADHPTSLEDKENQQLIDLSLDYAHEMNANKVISVSVKKSIENFIENDKTRMLHEEMTDVDSKLSRKGDISPRNLDFMSCHHNGSVSNNSSLDLTTCLPSSSTLSQEGINFTENTSCSCNGTNVSVATDDASQLFNLDIKFTNGQQSNQFSVAVPWSEDSDTSEDETLTENLSGGGSRFEEKAKLLDIRKPSSPYEEPSWSSHHWMASFGDKNLISQHTVHLEMHKEKLVPDIISLEPDTKESNSKVTSDVFPGLSESERLESKGGENKVEVIGSSPEILSAGNDMVQSSSDSEEPGEKNKRDISGESSYQSSESVHSSGITLEEIESNTTSLSQRADLKESSTEIISEGFRRMSNDSLIALPNTPNQGLPDYPMALNRLPSESASSESSVEKNESGVKDVEQYLIGDTDFSLQITNIKTEMEKEHEIAPLTSVVANEPLQFECKAIQVEPTLQDADTQAWPSQRDNETQITSSLSRRSSEQTDGDISGTSREGTEDFNFNTEDFAFNTLNVPQDKLHANIDNVRVCEIPLPESSSDSEIVSTVLRKKSKPSKQHSDNDNFSSSSHKQRSSTSHHERQCSCRGCSKLRSKIDALATMMNELTTQPLTCDESTEDDSEEKKLHLTHALDLANRMAKRLKHRSVQMLQSLEGNEDDGKI